ncbi:PTS maltose transporter subunit IICB OS=Streptomyces tendae OX=1932 GN=GUR47_06290 PE=4 SV=1 [Streptomyces tendae]
MRRSPVKALLVSGVVACVVGGITEPLEFLFLFVAPWLYVIHAVLVGLGFLTAAVLGVFIGNTDGNVIDWLVFGVLQGSTTKWYLVPVIAAVWFAAYYFLFRWAITRFDLKTPGREDPSADGERGEADDLEDGEEHDEDGGGRAPERARELVAGKYDAAAMLDAIGGAGNIRSLDNCITRLRMTVADAERVDEARLKKLGAVGVIKLDGHNVQVVIGPQVQSVKDAIATMIPVG